MIILELVLSPGLISLCDVEVTGKKVEGLWLTWSC